MRKTRLSLVTLAAATVPLCRVISGVMRNARSGWLHARYVRVNSVLLHDAHEDEEGNRIHGSVTWRGCAGLPRHRIRAALEVIHMRVSVFRASLVLLCLLSVGVIRASAQFDTASVVGVVKDSSGAVVPGAKVTLTNTETGGSNIRTTVNDGSYEFSTVRPGIYVVSAEQS